jgi:hypothetical protein
MSDLRSKIIRLAHTRPDLRAHLLPLVASVQDDSAAIAAKLNVAQKALRAVPVAEAQQLRAKCFAFDRQLDKVWNVTKDKFADENVMKPLLQEFDRLKAEVYKNLKLQSKVALAKGTLFAEKLMADTKTLSSLTYPYRLGELAAQATYLDRAALLSFKKAERAAELVTYYGKWLDFAETNDRAPSYFEQSDFMRLATEAPTTAKFEEGKPADPTKNMSKEDKAKWEAMKDEHKDQFKKD